MLCLVIQLCPTLCEPLDCSPPGFSVNGDSPGKNTGMSCHALLQGIFWWYRQTLSHLSHQRSPISSEATPPLYSPPPSWEPSLLPLCSLTTFHFMIAFLAFYIVCVFFFFYIPLEPLAQCETRSRCAGNSCQTERRCQQTWSSFQNENGQPRQQGNKDN